MNNPILLFTSKAVSAPDFLKLWRLRCALTAALLALALSCSGLVPSGRAQDGGYFGGNTAEGSNALSYLITHINIAPIGVYNTAIGEQALYGNSTGSYNTASGERALYGNTTGNNNTATGDKALLYNNGDSNTGTGSQALYSNVKGGYNTATGFKALYNSSDNYNTATEALSLLSNRTGIQNTAIGAFSLQNNDTGQNNAACGVQALFNNTTGSSNTAVGMNALYNSNGNSNIALGAGAGANLTTGSNNIVIGAGVLGASGDTNVTRIGKTTQKKTFISGIYNKTVASGVGVIVNAGGQLGTVQSSARYKDHIKPMDKASEAILALKPVTFRYKQELDPDHIPQFGLIAEEVEKVDPDLIVRDEDGKVSTVRYEAVNAMLLNEFLKEHRTVQELKATVAKQQQTITQQQTDFERRLSQQQKQIQSLTAVLQKVNSKIELESASQPLATSH